MVINHQKDPSHSYYFDNERYGTERVYDQTHIKRKRNAMVHLFLSSLC